MPLSAEERAAKRAADREEYRRWADQHAPEKAPAPGSAEAKKRDRKLIGGTVVDENEPRVPVSSLELCSDSKF